MDTGKAALPRPDGPLAHSKLIRKLSFHKELPLGLRLNVVPPALLYPLVILVDTLYEGYYLWLLLPVVFFLHLLSFFVVYWVSEFKAFVNYRSARTESSLGSFLVSPGLTLAIFRLPSIPLLVLRSFHLDTRDLP